ncbi:MAG: glycosyltransferase family 2 protein [Flavobacterium sp.]|nr:MAG: glycosyltransferase family 2 protein [Flavobacterium sp.]
MGNHPVVSIIVPCYNQGQYLSECIQSVLDQTYPHWECIIVNDGSPDDTEKISKDLCKLNPRIHYVSKVNGGLSSARNAGVRASSGLFILPLDADDKINPEYLQLAVEAYTKNPQLKIVYAQAEKFGYENCPWKLADYSFKGLLIANMIYCSAVYRRSDFDAVGGYDEEMKKGWEDWEFWIRMLNDDHEVYRIPKVMFYYRVKQSSMITSIGEKVLAGYKNYIYLKHKAKYDRYFDSPLDLIHENIRLLKIYRDSPDYKLGNRIINPVRRVVHFFFGK